MKPTKSANGKEGKPGQPTRLRPGADESDRQTPGAPSHLGKSAAATLTRCDDDRIAHIRTGGWMPLRSSTAFVKEMELLLQLGHQTRPRNLLLLGEPNSGKTSILERFAELHAINTDPDTPTAIAEVVRVQCPRKPDGDALCTRLLDAVFAPYKPKDKYETHIGQVKIIYKKIGNRMIIVDDFHNAIQGTQQQQNQFFTTICDISNDVRCHFVIAGTQKAATLLSSHEQMTSRFKPFRMPAWAPGNELATLLATMENRIPLRSPSNLKSAEMMLAVSQRAGTRLGDIIDLVRECAVEAIRRAGGVPSKEYISKDLIATIPWVAPTDREHFDKFLPVV